MTLVRSVTTVSAPHSDSASAADCTHIYTSVGGSTALPDHLISHLTTATWPASGMWSPQSRAFIAGSRVGDVPARPSLSPPADQSLCQALEVQCDTDRTKCEDTSGVTTCQCRDGYFKHSRDDLSCRGRLAVGGVVLKNCRLFSFLNFTNYFTLNKMLAIKQNMKCFIL